jgi:hypothetical protein
VTNILPKQEVKMLLHHCLVFTFQTGGSQIKDCEIHGTNVTSKRMARSAFSLSHKDQREEKTNSKKAEVEDALRLARTF